MQHILDSFGSLVWIGSCLQRCRVLSQYACQISVFGALNQVQARWVSCGKMPIFEFSSAYSRAFPAGRPYPGLPNCPAQQQQRHEICRLKEYLPWLLFPYCSVNGCRVESKGSVFSLSSRSLLNGFQISFAPIDTGCVIKQSRCARWMVKAFSWLVLARP